MLNCGRGSCQWCGTRMYTENNEGGYCSRYCRMEGMQKDLETMGLYDPERKGWTQAAVDYIEANNLPIDYDCFPE